MRGYDDPLIINNERLFQYPTAYITMNAYLFILTHHIHTSGLQSVLSIFTPQTKHPSFMLRRTQLSHIIWRHLILIMHFIRTLQNVHITSSSSHFYFQLRCHRSRYLLIATLLISAYTSLFNHKLLHSALIAPTPSSRTH